jgi:hypothetical protein
MMVKTAPLFRSLRSKWQRRIELSYLYSLMLSMLANRSRPSATTCVWKATTRLTGAIRLSSSANPSRKE